LNSVKTHLVVLVASLSLTATPTQGQGSFVYDQQSAVEGQSSEYAADVRTNQPFGQSFTPSLSSVGFVRFILWDAKHGAGSNLTTYVTLHSGSITGPVIGTTDSLLLAPGFNAPQDFLFPDPIPVTPGTTYYFQLVGQSSTPWLTLFGPFLYDSGNAFALGAPLSYFPTWDLWFREGVVVPEPSACLLGLLAASALAYARGKRTTQDRAASNLACRPEAIGCPPGFMKTSHCLLVASLSLSATSVRGQGTFIYDQQSALEGHYSESAAEVTTNQPFGQSFTPSLSSVGFVRFFLWDGKFGAGSNLTTYVTLHSGSITGPILGTSDSILLAPGFNAPEDFLFPNSVPVTPGTTYYLQLVGQSTTPWLSFVGPFLYDGGNAFALGAPFTYFPTWDLWFREGIVVPEPSACLLGLIAAFALIHARRRSSSSA
jgi:hypothetical protein